MESNGKRLVDLNDRRASAKSLLTTILGEFVLPLGGCIWTTTAVAALATFGVTERNARQALARLGDQGLIAPERQGRAVRWLLTEEGHRLLTAGAERIYSFGTRGDSWDGHWIVVLCSVAESQRAKRHQLRTRLTFEGFGFVAPSVAACPHLDREQAANEILRSLGLEGEALTLDARTASLTSDFQMIESAWELSSLASAYGTFLLEFGEIKPSTPEDAFRETIRLVDAWRHFPFLDPELPTPLLPVDWPGGPARALFSQSRVDWAPSARSWYRAHESET